MNDDVVPPEGAVKDIVLNEIDRDIVRMAARLLMALDPGETREIAALDHPKTALMRLVGDIAPNRGRRVRLRTELVASVESAPLAAHAGVRTGSGRRGDYNAQAQGKSPSAGGGVR